LSNSQPLADSNAKRNSTSAVFRASDLCWKVGDHLILDRLNFEIPRNKFIGIVGPNGAGKSSLLRCLFGKNQNTGGALFFNEKNIQSYSRKNLAKQIAVVLQEPPTHFDMSVLEIVSMGLIPKQSLFAFSSAEEKVAIKSAINSVELSHKTSMPLDEPTNHLDIQHQIAILHLVKTMKTSVLLSLHDLNMASAFCDQLILMDKGKIVAQGPCNEVLNRENLNRVFKVEALLDQHPFHSGLRINYNFSNVDSSGSMEVGND